MVNPYVASFPVKGHFPVIIPFQWTLKPIAIIFCLYLISSGKCTTGSQCNSLVVGRLWLHPPALRSKSIRTVDRWLVYGPFQLTHVSRDYTTQLINHVGTLTKQYWTLCCSNSATTVNLRTIIILCKKKKKNHNHNGGVQMLFLRVNAA